MERPTNEYLLDRFGPHAGYSATVYVRRNPALREEIMQAANLAIFVAAESFDWEASENCSGFGAYLKRAVQSECMEVVASLGYATSGSRRSLINGREFHGRGSVEASDADQTFVWGEMTDGEHIELIKEIAARVLSDRQYEAFARYYFEEIFSDKHVGELMGVRGQAVTKLRQRAIARIQQELQESS
jgi:RNA polymerase sigma factor (sigma-70 family)